jgi:hypothetical protein
VVQKNLLKLEIVKYLTIQVLPVLIFRLRADISKHVDGKAYGRVWTISTRYVSNFPEYEAG